MKGITLNEIIALVESLDFEFEFIQNLQTETKNHSEFSDKEVSELFWRKKTQIILKMKIPSVALICCFSCTHALLEVGLFTLINIYKQGGFPSFLDQW